jgi:acetyl-CoA decarbonylase/synthase complex subunit gamma
MDVEVIEIYKLLPRVDCGQCSAKTCMAFARAILEDRVTLSECVRLTPHGLMMIEDLLCRAE